jgi:Regulator of ribonuclease activity B
VGFLDRLRQKRPPDPELDRVILAQLRALGADLAHPRHVLHFLYFPDETSAKSASTAVERAGYEATVTPPGEGSAQWSVRAEATRVVDESTVDAYRAQFEQIAFGHGGEYDGWEAAAEP